MTPLATHPRHIQYLADIRWTPGDDLLRWDFADWLEENAAGVACPECGPPRAFPPYPWVCTFCLGQGTVWPDAERAEFIRTQCELARLGCLNMSGNYAVHRCNPTPSGPPCRAPYLASARLLARGVKFGWFDVPGWTTRTHLPAPDVGWYFNVTDSRPGAAHSVAGYANTGTVSRGFVSHLTLPAAAFTDGVARAVFERFPVEAVTLTGHPTADAVLSGAGHGAVSWGRSLAGLPPLYRDHASTAASPGSQEV